MSHTHPNPTDRERCIAYLLGEMPVQQATDFEAQLCDPQLAESLLRESELLLDISNASSVTPASLPFPAPTSTQSAAKSSRYVVIAMAAGLLLVVTAGVWSSINRTSKSRVAQSEPDTEIGFDSGLDIELANEWASHTNQWTSQDEVEELFAIDGLDELSLLSEDNFADSEDALASNDELEWIMVAFESSDAPEATNDG